MRSTQLWGITLALREEFPNAAELRIRKARKADKTVWQLVGKHPKQGKVARQLKALNESDVFLAAREMMRELDIGVKGRIVPTGQVRRVERAALEALEVRGFRDATVQSKAGAIRKVSSWLADNELGVEETSLRTAVETLSPVNDRKRRAMLEAARALAKATNTPFSAEGLRYKDPLPRRRKEVDDNDIFRRLDEHLPKIEIEGAIWLYRLISVVGVRANGALSMKIPDIFMGDDYPGVDGFQPGFQLPYWDSKRNRPGFATPTIRDWWEHWHLDNRPAELQPYLMPHDRPSSNEQIDKANRLLTFYSGELRRKVHKDAAESIGFRALRHAAAARLLKSGMNQLLVADLLSTSVAQLEACYSDMFRQQAVKEAERLL